MKRFLTLLFTTLLVSAALCVGASASDFDAAAEDLAAIGMFRGTESGFELDRAPTRSEAAIMLVRLYGAEEDAEAAYDAGEIQHPFTDVSEFASPYVAWVYSNGISKGTSADTFGAASPCSAQQYVVFLLRALGYQDGTDFQYDEAIQFAMTRGLFDVSMVSGDFLRDDLAAVTYQALACDLKDGSACLLQSLVDSGAIDADAAKPILDKITAYRTLTAASSADSLDTDFTLQMNVAMAADGQAEGEAVAEEASMAMDASGRIQMVLGDNPQMAMTMNTSLEGTDMDLGMWLKDGWLYVQMNDETYKQDYSEMLDQFLPLYQEILDQANASSILMPFIDTITTQKSGSDTVYTLTLNKAFEGMYNDLFNAILAEAAPVAGASGDSSVASVLGPSGLTLELGVDKMSYTYTVSSSGALKNASADAAMNIQMKMGGDQANALALTMKLDMQMEMDINAVGDSVKVSYPANLDQFPELPTSAAATVEGENNQTESAMPDSETRTVYVTQTGKRYHYDNSCNGGTYYPSTLEEALSRGLTPCEKCVA